MATKQDVDTLIERIGMLESAQVRWAEDTAALKDELSAIKAELVRLNELANVDLQPVITRVDNMIANAERSIGSQVGSDPDSPPPPSEGDESPGVITGDEEE